MDVSGILPVFKGIPFRDLPGVLTMSSPLFSQKGGAPPRNHPMAEENPRLLHQRGGLTIDGCALRGIMKRDRKNFTSRCRP